MDFLGEGGFGQVYRAEKNNGQAVALKCIQPRSKREEQWVRSEEEALRRLIHHVLRFLHDGAIVKMFRTYRSGMKVWISMEFMDGGLVADFLRKRKEVNRLLPEPVIAYILRRVLTRIAFMHSIERLQRDIKGDNVLLTSDGKVKVADFGLCVELTVQLKKPITVCGTTPYMAPELFRGRTYTSEVEIWSIGILAIECAEFSAP